MWQIELMWSPSTTKQTQRITIFLFGQRFSYLSEKTRMSNYLSKSKKPVQSHHIFFFNTLFVYLAVLISPCQQTGALSIKLSGLSQKLFQCK